MAINIKQSNKIWAVFVLALAFGIISYQANAALTFNVDSVTGSNALTLTGATDSSAVIGGVTTGTLLSAIKLTPKASVATDTITRHQLVAFGDVTGNTAFGFGDVTKPTYGVMASFGRTAIATGSWTGTDTAMDIRAINTLVNNAAYQMQGAYIKAKNYTGGTVGSMKGLYVETDNSGTATTVYGLELSTPGSAITDMIKMTGAKAAYGIDMNGGTLSTADIRLMNGEVISNSTDGTISFGAANLVTTGVVYQKNISAASNVAATPVDNTTVPSETCDANKLGSVMMVDATDSVNAWLWACQQTDGSTYAWKKMGGTN